MTDKGVTEDVDADLKAVIENTKLVEAKMDELRVADAITEIFNCSNAATNISMRPCRGYWQKMRRRKIVWKLYCGT